MAVGLVNRYNIFGIIIKLTMKQSYKNKNGIALY